MSPVISARAGVTLSPRHYLTGTGPAPALPTGSLWATSTGVEDLAARSLEGDGFAPHPCQTILEKHSKALATSFGVTGNNIAWETPPLSQLRTEAVNKTIFALTPRRSKLLLLGGRSCNNAVLWHILLQEHCRWKLRGRDTRVASQGHKISTR